MLSTLLLLAVLNLVFSKRFLFRRAYQSALSRYSNTDAFQRDLAIFRVPPPRRVIESAFRWLLSLKACAPLVASCGRRVLALGTFETVFAN